MARYRKLKIKTISSNKIDYRLKKVGRHRCKNCFTILKGVPNSLGSKHYGIAKSVRLPSRIYGGNLCSSCCRDAIFNKAKEMVMEDG